MTDRPLDPGRPREPDLDDTQPVDVPRFEPAPERRGGWPTPSGGAWWEPAATTTTPVPAARVAATRRGGVFGPVLLASALSAVLASGGTVLVLDGVGAFDRPATATLPTGQVTSTSGGPTVQITEDNAVIDAAAKVSPAVVRITVAGAGDFDGGQFPATGVGSGVIYHSDGWIVTNKHVVEGGDQLTVELKDGRQFPGRVYGIDTLTDLAIVKVDAAGLPMAQIGSADGLKIGQKVIAIGSPLGTYSFSVTQGIVSGKGRSIQVDGGERLNNLIQTDAAINPGNSGGPLVDTPGTIVGINTAIASDANGIGFAIPIDIARPILEQALRGEQLARPWIGIRFESVDLQLKQRANLPVENGALVTAGGQGEAVVADSPAATAGLQEGDIIVAIEGIAVDQEHPLDALLVRFAPGRTINLSVLRAGQTVQMPVTLGTRPGDL
jgi:S1-C subfamily serine protease